MSLSGAPREKSQDRHPDMRGPIPPNGPRPGQGRNVRHHKRSLLNSNTDPAISRFVSSLINEKREKR